MKQALIFVSRCQNLETPHNTTPFAAKNPDGGFYYTAAGGGSSLAGKTPEGGLRSYGSMTYAGLKSMIYAGVKADDPRVKAAFEWIQKHYALADNPGMGDAGLYYYYHTFAKALDAMKVGELSDAAGAKHDWRRELREELVKRQQPDGSWVNKNARWMEGDPNLVTGYALSDAFLLPAGEELVAGGAFQPIAVHWPLRSCDKKGMSPIVNDQASHPLRADDNWTYPLFCVGEATM